MWGYIVLFVGIIIFLFDLYFAFISFGFFKKGCKKCKGYLVHTVRRKNIYKRRFFYKNYLNFVYVYCVNGKEYHISEGVPGKKSNIGSVVDVIYQKKNPKFAYIRNLTFPNQPIIAVLLCPTWFILVLCGFLLI